MTEANYHSVFNDSPVPMLIYDPTNWSVLDVNTGAVKLYGYILEQIKQLNLLDLLAHNKDDRLDVEYKNALMTRWHKSQWVHHRNNGATFLVQISGDATTYIGTEARIAMVIDVTEDEKAKKEKEAVINKLQDYAFYASHNMRRPLSSIMSLMDLIKMSWDDKEGYEELMSNLQIATMDLDEVIRVMNAKLELD
jgi:PAS domain S-box-containing protein